MKRFLSLLLPLLLTGLLACSSTEKAAQTPSNEVDRPDTRQEAPETVSVSSDESSDEGLLSVELLWEMERFGSPVISPDGKWIVAPLTRYTVDDDKSHTDLWLFSPDGSVERPLTRHGSADGQPVFSPDSRKLAFITRREGDEQAQLYVMPLDQPGEAVRLVTVPTGVSAPKWVGGHIYFISRVWPGKTWGEMEAELEKQRASHISARIWNQLPYSHWDHWIDEERQAHLFRVPAVSGGYEDLFRARERSACAGSDLLSRCRIEAITEPTGRELP
ncbi:hypothetical protein QLX67_10485, partial [Balneolaceae bacterium ANBcel3]|nr:hypothetical protein [Balneolaceae bacterium ANBcel3]